MLTVQLASGSELLFKVVQTVSQAATAFPNDSEFAKATRWFESAANTVFATGSLDDALAIISRALQAVPSAEHNQLIDFRTTIVRLQSQRELQNLDVDASLTTLLRFDPQPTDSEMAAAVVFHVQEALRITYEKGGIERTLSHIATLNQKLPQFEKLQLQFHQFATQSVQKLVKNNKIEEAFALAKKWPPAFKDETAGPQLRACIYIQWGGQLEKQNGFALAYEKLIGGMKDCPKSEELAARAENCVARITAIKDVANNPQAVTLATIQRMDNLSRNLAIQNARKALGIASPKVAQCVLIIQYNIATNPIEARPPKSIVRSMCLECIATGGAISAGNCFVSAASISKSPSRTMVGGY